MRKEVRVVPRNWEHPKDGDNNFIAKLYGFEKFLDDLKKEINKNGLRKTLKEYVVIDIDIYMDNDWKDRNLKPELFMMYENTTEGTPISPAFETLEELARWLADNKASSFANMTA